MKRQQDCSRLKKRKGNRQETHVSMLLTQNRIQQRMNMHREREEDTREQNKHRNSWVRVTTKSSLWSRRLWVVFVLFTSFREDEREKQEKTRVISGLTDLLLTSLTTASLLCLSNYEIEKQPRRRLLPPTNPQSNLVFPVGLSFETFKWREELLEKVEQPSFRLDSSRWFLLKIPMSL
jgi:hypothetical protein